MSGVCGTWTQASDPQRSTGVVQAGLEAIAHRGRDGVSIHADGNVALGHCLLDTGCNGMFVDEAGFAISLDGRLDNRAALIALLREDGALDNFQTMPDEALLLLAYRRFGPSFPEHLRGDYALAIWNPSEKSLFLCRDHFGVRPLFYRRAEGAFYFASEIKALRAMMGDSPLTVRDGAITGYVQGEFANAEPDRTFYREVLRLLPGHSARIGADGMQIDRYWSLDPDHPVRHPDTGARFRELFAQAIDRRLRTTGSLGALLSGGLDSSSIVSMIGAGKTRATPATVKVFSMTFPDAAIEDETPYIDAVLNAYPIAGTKIPVGGVTAFQNLDAIIVKQDHPPPAPNTCTFSYFLQTIASRDNPRVVLHGHGGDEVISHGTGLFPELAESGQWLRLWRELGQSEGTLGPRRRHFGRLLRKKSLSRLRRTAGRWLKRRRLATRDTVLFGPDGRARPPAQVQHLREVTSPLFCLALEVTDHDAAAAGMELRMPFLDVDLVSFCVTVRAEEKWVGGYSRSLLRRSLSGILPELVARRRDKFDFGQHLQQSMLRDHAALVEEVLHVKASWLAPYADICGLRDAWRSLRHNNSAADGKSMTQVWRAVILSRWLQLISGEPANAACPPALEAAQ